MSVHLLHWGAFVAFILAMLALDLFVLHRRAHEVSFREAAGWTLVWVVLGVAFGGLVWVWQGGTAAGEYLAGYLIEKTLSVDNVFVFAVLFSYFAVPAAYQHRVLFWGVLGALAFRAAFILGGVAILESFHWTIYLFGAFLVLTGLKVAKRRKHEVHPERNPVLGLIRRAVPMTTGYDGQRLFVRTGGRSLATPLFAVLVAVETTDIVFAVDSIPAIFAVTHDPFLVFTSNAFAMLGLRAMYFLLAGMMKRLAYLRTALALILVLGGLKMLLSPVLDVPIWVTVAVVAGIVAVAVQRERMSLRDLREMVVSHRSVEPELGPILSGAFDLRYRTLREVLVPRRQVVFLDAMMPVREAIGRLADAGHSRAPVLGEGDDVVGVAHLIDLVRGGEGTVGDHDHPVLALPDHLGAIPALRRLQRERHHLAVVVNEHGSTAGIVTVEDLAEQVFGEFADEFDLDLPDIRREPDGSLLVSGLLSAHELREWGVDLPRGRYSTVAGYLLHRLGHVPAPGEHVDADGWRLEVLSSDDRVVGFVRFVPNRSGLR